MPHKENRKLVRIGNTSLGVIIPKSWLRFYKLKYGDNVEVISNGSIEIKPANKTAKPAKRGVL